MAGRFWSLRRPGGFSIDQAARSAQCVRHTARHAVRQAVRHAVIIARDVLPVPGVFAALSVIVCTIPPPPVGTGYWIPEILTSRPICTLIARAEFTLTILSYCVKVMWLEIRIGYGARAGGIRTHSSTPPPSPDPDNWMTSTINWLNVGPTCQTLAQYWPAAGLSPQYHDGNMKLMWGIWPQKVNVELDAGQCQG